MAIQWLLIQFLLLIMFLLVMARTEKRIWCFTGGALTAMLYFLTEIVNAGVSHVGFKQLFRVS